MNKIKNKDGVTMVETAAMLFVIFIILGFIITGGQMMNNKNALNYATMSATRAAGVQPTRGSAETVAKEMVTEILESNGISTSNVVVRVTAPSGWIRGKNFTVSATTNYKTMFPVPNSEGTGLGGTKINRMTSQVTAMIEAR